MFPMLFDVGIRIHQILLLSDSTHRGEGRWLSPRPGRKGGAIASTIAKPEIFPLHFAFYSPTLRSATQRLPCGRNDHTKDHPWHSHVGKSRCSISW
jgi:hypothetical protein